MMALAPADRTKLAKLLALLSSNHQGERDAAGLAAHRLVVAKGATWEDVIQPPPVSHSADRGMTWQRMVECCLQRPGSLRPWERDFLGGLRRFPRLSLKQRRCLHEISERVLGDVA